MKWLSLAADVGFAGSLILLSLAVLAFRGHLRLAVCWGGGMIVALGITVLIKRAMAQDPVFPYFPSGHVALAVAFYGGLILVLLQPLLSSRRLHPLVVVLVLAAIALVEGISRIELTDHVWLDVVGGFVVAGIGLALTGNPWAYDGLGRKDRYWLVGLLVAGTPVAWLAYSLLDPWIRGVVGV